MPNVNLDLQFSTGTLIRLHRQKQGMTQTELAEALGIDQSVLSRYEADQRRPQQRVLQRIASALGVKREDLLPTWQREGVAKHEPPLSPNRIVKTWAELIVGRDHGDQVRIYKQVKKLLDAEKGDRP